MRVVPSSFVPHMIGPTLAYNGQSPTFSCSVRAKANTRLFLSGVIDIKKRFGPDWSHLFIKMFFCLLKGQKLPLRILEKMIWEFTLVLLQTLMEFHQATQLMRKVDTMSIKHACFAFPPVFPCCCASQMHKACTPYITSFLSFAEMKRLLALSHERKFPSKWFKHVCRGELCMQWGITKLLSPSGGEVITVISSESSFVFKIWSPLFFIFFFSQYICILLMFFPTCCRLLV